MVLQKFVWLVVHCVALPQAITLTQYMMLMDFTRVCVSACGRVDVLIDVCDCARVCVCDCLRRVRVCVRLRPLSE